MSDAFAGLEPRILWSCFEQITQVPRPSKKEGKIIASMEQWAAEHGFEVVKDAVENLLIKVPATPGREAVPPVCMQGHLDMVPEKNEETEFDFETDPIQVWRDGDWLKARGTTLGADNGIGLAMAMAVATDPTVSHGPLELLFTIDEETGLTGAMALSPGFLASRKLINIDSEEEGVLFVGCAGGGDSDIVWARPRSRSGVKPVFKVQVTGLQGGHSGLNIVENRGNAIKLMAHFLDALGDEAEFGLASIDGGDKHNAIPRQCAAVIVGDELDPVAIEAVRKTILTGFMQEFSAIEPDAQLLVTEEPDAALPHWWGVDREQVLDLILSIPHGVRSMCRGDLTGLVETSTNLARVRTDDDTVELLTSSRSSVEAALVNLRESIAAVATLAGAAITLHESYPAWQPNMDSELLARCKRVHEEVTGKAAQVTIIHAGLECGIIGEPYEDMEMISFGPTMHGVHSPAERLSIQSTANVYEYLKALISSM
ncbi:MAG: aminoacyl-histidine dipeptidase [Pseudomonadota bacterium]